MNPAAPAAPFAAGGLAQLTFSLLLIVALILGLSWLMKRLRIGGGARSRGGITVIDELAVGPRDRIVLVGIGSAQVLVGRGPEHCGAPPPGHGQHTRRTGPREADFRPST